MSGEEEIKIEGKFSYPLPTIESYRDGLENCLELTQEPQGEDRKDLGKWLSSVSFMEKRKKAPLKGMIHYRSGLGLVALSSEKPLPEVITPETPPSDILEVQARTAAKLAFVSELDKIPLEVRDKARKVAKDVNKEAKQILNNLSQQREVPIGDKNAQNDQRRIFKMGSYWCGGTHLNRLRCEGRENPNHTPYWSYRKSNQCS